MNRRVFDAAGVGAGCRRAASRGGRRRAEHGQEDRERRALPGRRAHLDGAAVLVDDALADRAGRGRCPSPWW